MIKDKRILAFIVIGFLLMAYHPARSNSIYYNSPCQNLTPYSWEWWFEGCIFFG